MKTYAFDIETYPNMFSCVFEDVLSDEKHVFYAHEGGNNMLKFLAFVDRPQYLVGYNSLGFDSLLIVFILMNIRKYKDMSKFILAINFLANDIISLQSGDSFYEDKAITRLRWYGTRYTNIDLYTLVGLNKIRKSLKQVSVNLRWHKIQELPIEPGTYLTPEQVQQVITYNHNDVGITKALFLHVIDEVRLRFKINKLYNVYTTNSSRSNMANKLLDKFYSEYANIPIDDFKDLRTEHSIIKVKDCISDKIVFKTKVFKDLLATLKAKSVRNTKQELEMSIAYDLIKYNLGSGGLHSEDPPDVFKATDELSIIDADVSSYYPSLILQEMICPRHLHHESFLQVVDMIKRDRIEAKTYISNPKVDTTDSKYKDAAVRADGLKIVINSSFGKMGYEYYWLYDRKAMVSVTFNGQLGLLMLIEMLVEGGFKVISANTDGVIALVDNSRKDEYYAICKEWEQLLGLDLDYTHYSKYIRRDVNNYLAIKTNGKVKRKGIFTTSIDMLKGYPTLVINKAINEYFLNNVQPSVFIKGHTDIYDFCMSQKINKDYNMQIEYIKDKELVIEPLQRVVRFFASTKGGALFKVKDAMIHGTSAKTSICAKQVVTVFNDYYDPKDNVFSNYNIDYNYYIKKADDIINKIIYRIKKKTTSRRIKAGGANKSNHYMARLFDDELLSNTK